jgi:hypothetical protein
LNRPTCRNTTPFPLGCGANGVCQTGKFTNYNYDSNGLFQSGYITLPGDNWRGSAAGSGNGTTAGGMQQNVTRRMGYDSTENQDFGFNAKVSLDDH